MNLLSPVPERIRVLHVITGLEVGGAERMLAKLLARIEQPRFHNVVIALTRDGPIGAELREHGVPVEALGMRRGIPSLGRLVRLARRIRAFQPDIVQTWMYHADLMGGMAARLAGCPAVVWNLRQSTFDVNESKRLTQAVMKLGAWLSPYLPDRIVCCSEQVARVHVDIAYASEKMTVIPNGFDMDRFRSDVVARRSLRAELGIEEDQFTVGMVARFDRQKDHRTFVDAAAVLRERVPGAVFVLAGDGLTTQNRELVGWLEERGIRQQVRLLGRRADVPRLVNAFDIATLTSAFGEGFPNVVGEAMACEVPCVVTDVGGSAEVVGEAGRVVSRRDAGALADAWLDLWRLGVAGRRALGRAARARVQSNFDINSVAARYAALYESLAAHRAPLTRTSSP